LLNDNFHTVEKGTLYRSGQMADRRLKWIVRRHGVRTVINLRGAHPDESWYREEIAVCEQLRVAHYDLGWTMRAAPEPESLSQLIEWFETVERPILVHCQGGVHRAAVASAAYRLMDGDSTAEARGELGLFFRSAPIGQALAWYENSEKPFAQWVKADYPRLYAENGAGRD
jgi:protein tyrosine/serine phosphatase